MQASSFVEETSSLQKGSKLSPKSKLLPLRPFLDPHGILRVGGQASLSKLPFSKRHPAIHPGDHTLAKLIITSEHLRLLHGGPSLVAASLSRRFYVLGSCRAIRSITRSCVTYRRASLKPQPQMLGQLPADRLVPGSVFQYARVNYAGPILMKSDSACKPIRLCLCVRFFLCQGCTLGARIGPNIRSIHRRHQMICRTPWQALHRVE